MFFSLGSRWKFSSSVKANPTTDARPFSLTSSGPPVTVEQSAAAMARRGKREPLRASRSIGESLP